MTWRTHDKRTALTILLKRENSLRLGFPKGLVKTYRGEGGGPEHLEMWLIKNT